MVMPKKRPNMAPRIIKGPKIPPAIGQVIPRKMVMNLKRKRPEISAKVAGDEGERDPTKNLL